MLDRPDPHRGGEPLGGVGSEDLVALLQASEAVASAQYAPILQMEWESSVDWGESQQYSPQPAASLSHEERELYSTPGSDESCLAENKLLLVTRSPSL